MLHAPATAAGPALLLRPWTPADLPALVEVCRDPVLRRWTSHEVADEADGIRWLATEQRGWEAGDRLGFAVLETGPTAGSGGGRLAGSVVLKGAAAGRPTAEVGYWTAAHARGRGVAPRALEALTDWAFTAFGPAGPARLDLLHQLDNLASCRVAEKSGYALEAVLTAAPPEFPREGHLHVRRAAG